MTAPLFHAIGLMSGTSMDGIDASLLVTDGDTPREELAFLSITYDKRFQRLLKAVEYAFSQSNGNEALVRENFSTHLNDFLVQKLNLKNPQNVLNDFSEYLYQVENQEIQYEDIVHHSTELHIEIVQQLLQTKNLKPEEIDVIGYHGQTVYHEPEEKVSIQLGDGEWLATKTGIKVVNDFRSNDIRHGGQGAPFAPLYHRALAERDERLPIAFVNCGGISNVTLISDRSFMAYDAGPGNVFLDAFVRERTQGAQVMDCNGEYAKKGRVDVNLLNDLFALGIQQNQQNYCLLPPPKSLDTRHFKLNDNLREHLKAVNLENGCRTLAALTAECLVHSLQYWQDPMPTYWVLSGGGWKNPVLLQEFKHRLCERYGAHLQVIFAQDLGWNSESMEAQIFAHFAVRSLQDKPLSEPSTTGVVKPVSGGMLFEPQSSS